MTNRVCGGCTLCCRLLPVAEIGKTANQRCPHQRHGKGCAIYEDRPLSCRFWSCAWLDDRRTFGMMRPDRAHYVVDIELDFVTLSNPDEPDQKLPVVQVWVDTAYPHAHRDPGLRAYLARINMPALVRCGAGATAALLLVPPGISGEADWIEMETRRGGEEHSYAERMAAFAEMVEDGRVTEI